MELDFDNIDLVSSSVKINADGSVCVILYEIVNDDYSNFNKDNLKGFNKVAIKSLGCNS